MKKEFVKILSLFVVLSVPYFAQVADGGDVVDIVDGRTIVVAARSRHLKVELQFIEVPGPGHKFHETVKDHLEKLLLGRRVQFIAGVTLQDRVVGRVFLNNVDISQQMLRDGAARHVPRARSRQGAGEFELYASFEAAAKSEKRGVWSVAEPFPSVVEKPIVDTPRPVIAAVSRRGSPAVGVFDAGRLLEAWVNDLPVESRRTDGLKKHTDQRGAYTAISTPLVVLEFASEGGKQTIECRAIYAAAHPPKSGDGGLFALGLRSPSKDNDLLKVGGSISVAADRYLVSLGSLAKTGSQSGADEMRYFRISKGFLARIANTRTVELHIDGFKTILNEEAKEFFRELLSAADKPS
jgi:endonuclease YncB( thermonuclease family)